MPHSGSARSELPLERLVREGLDELGIGPRIASDLARLAELLHSWARRISLTGHRSPDAIARRLVLDAIALERQLPETDSVADLGAGAGFPGLPIAIARPGCRVSLVEARERRHHFQRAAVRELGLERVNPIRGRAEALEPREHGIALAQAMGKPDQVAHWLLPWVAPGGLLVIPGAEAPPKVGPIPGLSPARVVSYAVPLGGARRTLWLARRSAGFGA